MPNITKIHGKKDTDMSIQTIQPKDLPKTYDGLMQEHMIRPIHDAVNYENACEVLDTLSGLDLNGEQAEYLEALSILVEAYEHEQKGLYQIEKV